LAPGLRVMHSLARVWIFGSRYKGTARAESDLDVAVELTDEAIVVDQAQAGFNVWLSVCEQCQQELETLTGLPVQLEQYHATATPRVVSYVAAGSRLVFQRAPAGS